MTSNEATVVAEALSQNFGATVALSEVSFELTSGITALVGINGAGKSTLMSSMAGLRRPDHGRVTVDGDEVYGTRRKHALTKTALVPQFTSFPKNLTALELVSYVGWMRGLAAPSIDRAARSALQQVDLTDQARTKIGRLSGGMLRRLALAQAIVAEPRVLLLDEPSTGLDPQQRRRMVDLMANLSGTVLVSSHVMEDVAELATRVLLLHGGRLRFDGSTASLADRAPAQTPEGRRLEAGFLSVCMAAERA